MEFKLSDSLIDDIIFAMEDQNKEFLIDAENCCVVDAEFDFEKIEADGETFYSLPALNSERTDGDRKSLVKDSSRSYPSALVHAGRE